MFAGRQEASGTTAPRPTLLARILGTQISELPQTPLSPQPNWVQVDKAFEYPSKDPDPGQIRGCGCPPPNSRATPWKEDPSIWKAVLPAPGSSFGQEHSLVQAGITSPALGERLGLQQATDPAPGAIGHSRNMLTLERLVKVNP